MLMTGCAYPGRPVASNTDQIPIQWTTLSFSDATPLIKLRTPGDSVTLAYKLEPPIVERPIYVGEIENGDKQMLPVVLIKQHGQLQALRMEKDWAFDQWTRLIYGPADGEIWGVLDQADENHGEDFALVHSLNQGETWQVGVIRKPCDNASIYDFVMAKDGRGRFTLNLPDQCPGNEKLKPGLYHYRTTDNGKTWSTPNYEPDATKPAEEVPQEEQPDQGKAVASVPSPRYSGRRVSVRGLSPNPSKRLAIENGSTGTRPFTLTP